MDEGEVSVAQPANPTISRVASIECVVGWFMTLPLFLELMYLLLPMSKLAAISLGDLVTIAHVGELMRHEPSKRSRICRLYFDEENPSKIAIVGGSATPDPQPRSCDQNILERNSQTGVERKAVSRSGCSDRSSEMVLAGLRLHRVL